MWTFSGPGRLTADFEHFLEKWNKKSCTTVEIIVQWPQSYFTSNTTSLSLQTFVRGFFLLDTSKLHFSKAWLYEKPLSGCFLFATAPDFDQHFHKSCFINTYLNSHWKWCNNIFLFQLHTPVLFPSKKVQNLSSTVLKSSKQTAVFFICGFCWNFLLFPPVCGPGTRCSSYGLQYHTLFILQAFIPSTGFFASKYFIAKPRRFGFSTNSKFSITHIWSSLETVSLFQKCIYSH